MCQSLWGTLVFGSPWAANSSGEKNQPAKKSFSLGAAGLDDVRICLRPRGGITSVSGINGFLLPARINSEGGELLQFMAILHVIKFSENTPHQPCGWSPPSQEGKELESGRRENPKT